MKFECKFKHKRSQKGGPGETRYFYNIPATIEADSPTEAFNRYYEHLVMEKQRYAHYLDGNILMYVTTEDDEDEDQPVEYWKEVTI